MENAPGVITESPKHSEIKKAFPVEYMTMNDICETVVNVYLFILLLRIKIKIMSERDFKNFLKT